MPTEQQKMTSRVAAVAIVAASGLSVVFMMYHPTVHGRSPADLVRQLGETAFVNGLVHGSLMAMQVVLLAAYSVMTSRLDAGGFGGRLALSSYAVGTLAMLTAAAVSGFIIPEYGLRYEGRSAEELEAMRHGLALVRAVNQVCSRIGVMALSMAVACWAVTFLRQGWRGVGVLGLLAGGVPSVAMLVGWLPMDVHGMLAFVAAQMIWGLAGALWMWGRARDSASGGCQPAEGL